MTANEKLAVIAGNLREARAGEGRINSFVLGNLYELAQISRESDSAHDALDTAKLVLPEGDMEMLAEFCRIYSKYFGDGSDPFHGTDYSENSDAVAIPEIPRLEEAVSVLAKHGLRLRAEYGDSFSSCAEDVSFGGSGYVLMPYSDPFEGRLRSFDRLRSINGLNIHAVVYIDHGEGEYGYQLCGLGFSDNMPIRPARISFSAESDCEPLRYLRGMESFGAVLMSSEFVRTDNKVRLKGVLNIETVGGSDISGMLMYLGAVSDITIDGVYAEIHHKSKGMHNGLY